MGCSAQGAKIGFWTGSGRVLAALCLFGGAFAEEGGREIAPPPLPPLPYGVPYAPPAPPVEGAPLSFATQDGLPQAFPVPLPPPTPSEMSPSSPQARAVETSVPGVSVSDPIERQRVITAIRTERVAVYPEDPESAFWEINPRHAFARAQREQRPMLLLFTGLWNSQAMALSEEVFATKTFNEYVKDHLVICYLNYERNLTDNPDALRSLKERFNVRGYPNLLVFNPNGEVQSSLRGYRSGRPIDYFNRLKVACQPVLESIAAQKGSMVRYGYRDWSNHLGRAIFAKFLEHDGLHVRLGDLSGRDWLIPVKDLAPDDQRLVESFPPVPTIEIEIEIEIESEIEIEEEDGETG